MYLTMHGQRDTSRHGAVQPPRVALIRTSVEHTHRLDGQIATGVILSNRVVELLWEKWLLPLDEPTVNDDTIVICNLRP